MKVLWLALLGGSLASAATLSGVTLPDRVSLGGQELVLNGLGLREVVVFDVYVAGLYLPRKTADPSQAIATDVPKRLHLHFVRKVGADDMRESTLDAIRKNPTVEADVLPHIGPLNGAMESMAAGDDVLFDYVPGQGTAVSVKGQVKATIPGAPFMRGLWTLYLGPEPPTAALKRGLMGG